MSGDTYTNNPKTSFSPDAVLTVDGVEYSGKRLAKLFEDAETNGFPKGEVELRGSFDIVGDHTFDGPVLFGVDDQKSNANGGVSFKGNQTFRGGFSFGGTHTTNRNGGSSFASDQTLDGGASSPFSPKSVPARDSTDREDWRDTREDTSLIANGGSVVTHPDGTQDIIEDYNRRGPTGPVSESITDAASTRPGRGWFNGSTGVSRREKARAEARNNRGTRGGNMDISDHETVGSKKRMNNKRNMAGTGYGASKITGADGSSIEKDGHGNTVMIAANGSMMVKKKDGSSVMTAANGSSIEKEGHGNKVMIAANGSMMIKKKDGSAVMTAANGSSVERDRYGNRVIKSADGRTVRVRKNGSENGMRGRSGSYIENRGSTTWVGPNGDLHVTFGSNQNQPATIDGVTYSGKGLDRFRTGTDGRSLYIPGGARSVSIHDGDRSAGSYSRGTANEGGITMRNGITRRNGRLTVS